ncbi:cache domain-containing sensor histidine kinase [Paenibacillus prosopidis]|uniref:Two-component system sensor histidine kinase YesM n=1 Tax=Paenibacillus prosopidis TaxID=630520 RepID=A0A368VKK7_9BACL|nr:sensor histidine kinase [Paenibacillus prosopidis]RCW42239.1 two-component system sensor histidine kinase YesM [Paenibacillus prosopidis]
MNSPSKWRFVGFKMFIIYFVSMTISIMIMGYLSYNKANEIIQVNVGGVALQTVQQANKRLEMIMKEYENRSYFIFGYRELQKGILGEFRDNYERMQNTEQINKFLSSFANSKNDTANVFIFGEDAASYHYSLTSSPTFSVREPIEPMKQEQNWYTKIKEADGRPVWFGIRPSFIHENRPSEEAQPVFCYGRALKDIWGNGEIIGVLLIEIDPSEIQQILSEIDFKAFGTSIIVDRNNIVVGDSDGRSLLSPFELELTTETSGIKHMALDEKEMMVVYDQMAINDWKLVGMAPAQQLVKDSREIRLYTFYLATLFTVVAVILAWIIARQMHHPVQILLRSMRKAKEGDFETQIVNHRKDEFGILFDSFNIMVSRIKSLINELYVQRLLKKENQLKMLASQINAHFIYNTLDSIHWISRIHKVHDISTMIFGLSNYLRISLSDGRDKVTVREAVSLVESYLSVQKVRYQDKFEVNLEVDRELLDYEVLKFVFQPLVENAIYHGIESKRGKGRLDIRWIQKGGLLCFEVIDDGVGISPEKLRQIEEALESNDFTREENFALKNINSQIQLAYGEQYGLDLKSEWGDGTKVTLILPLS